MLTPKKFDERMKAIRKADEEGDYEEAHAEQDRLTMDGTWQR